MRVLVYSGDVDSCVPYLGTEACMDALGLPVVEPWRAWIVDGQVAGYVKVLGGRAGGPSLTYATVKEAGHMVPTYKAPLLFPSAFIFSHISPTTRHDTTHDTTRHDTNLCSLTKRWPCFCPSSMVLAYEPTSKPLRSVFDIRQFFITIFIFNLF
jgi:hypothetical protein